MFDIPVHDACPFCDYLAGTMPCAFVTRSNFVSAFMNRAQYERGAILLVTNRHLETVLDLDERLFRDLHLQAQSIARAMLKAFGAVGLNMCQNNGIRAGQTIAHYHLHLVPRYPDSEPTRIFREEDYPHASMHELTQCAAELRAAMR